MSSYFDDNDDIENKMAGSDDEQDINDNDSEIAEELEEDVEDIDDVDNIDVLDGEEDDDSFVGENPEEEDDDEEDIQYGGKNNEELEEGEDDVAEKSKKVKKVPAKAIYKKAEVDDDDEDEDEDGEGYLKKFDKEVNDNYILNFHPECALQNYDEIIAMTKVIKDKNNIIIDDLHRTIPYLTKYEKSRVLGARAKQINDGASVFIKVPENVIDGYLIAELELQEKRIPFIIRRPLPNGGSEYWSIKDLENIAF
jgi:DNA-directed RNA polymerase I, II, and III subunit RPABC2